MVTETLVAVGSFSDLISSSNFETLASLIGNASDVQTGAFWSSNCGSVSLVSQYVFWASNKSTKLLSIAFFALTKADWEEIKLALKEGIESLKDAIPTMEDMKQVVTDING